jgi:polysaccharide export outer membrane protein
MTLNQNLLKKLKHSSWLLGGAMIVAWSGHSPVAAQSMQEAVNNKPSLPLDTMPGSMAAPDFPGIPPVSDFPDQTEVFGISSSYRLGIGDVIGVAVFGAEEYSGEAIVLQDGTINLPRIGQVFVLGMTLLETEDTLRVRYGRFIRQPDLTVTPVNLRPVRIAVSGEVRRPGSYTIQRANEAQNANTFDSRFPTLTEAIAQAGGITGKANVREITLRRPVAYNRFEEKTFDLWELVQSGDLRQDVILQSGDEILVPTAIAITPDEATEIANASFAPEAISVFVAGEVRSPGAQQVPLNTPLNQVILNAGNFNNRARRSTVQLVRLNPNGTVTEREINIDLAASINEETNPILTDRDVIIVGRSGLAAFGDTAGIVLNPITQVLGAILGFQNLFD